jgi:hypothetical protein
MCSRLLIDAIQYTPVVIRYLLPDGLVVNEAPLSVNAWYLVLFPGLHG